jgi:hypothetical protein
LVFGIPLDTPPRCQRDECGDPSARLSPTVHRAPPGLLRNSIREARDFLLRQKMEHGDSTHHHVTKSRDESAGNHRRGTICSHRLMNRPGLLGSLWCGSSKEGVSAIDDVAESSGVTATRNRNRMMPGRIAGVPSERRRNS